MRLPLRRVLPALVLTLLAALGTMVATGTLLLVQTHGTSMQPLLHQGDLAVVVAGGSYRVGDVVAYRSEVLGTRVVHRVVAAGPQGLSIRGDNNPFVDPEVVPASRVEGRMWFRIPHGGVVGRASQTPWALLSVVLAVLALPAAAGRRRPLGGGRAARTRRRSPAPSVPALRRPLPTQLSRPPVRAFSAYPQQAYRTLPAPAGPGPDVLPVPAARLHPGRPSPPPTPPRTPVPPRRAGRPGVPTPVVPVLPRPDRGPPERARATSAG